MTLFALLIHLTFLVIYTLIVAALLWHYRKYSLPKDPARRVIGPFLLISLILMITSTILLFFVPWEALLTLAPTLVPTLVPQP
ncbi:hypothetical protein IIA95_00130 [Patescibacteria group bacterium]|nr:hypothetical protein [Patescibacteria group bacterium]